MSKLLTKDQFKDLAGISIATVSRLSNGILEPAIENKLIDIDHPLVVTYLKDKKVRESKEEGMDSLYQTAVDACREHGKCSINFLRGHLSIGTNRARKLVALLNATKVHKKPAPKKVSKLNPTGIKFKPVPDELKKPTPAKKVVKKAAKKVVKKAKKKVSAKKQLPKPEPEEEIEEIPEEDSTLDIPDDIKKFLDMKLSEIIDIFGTDARFEAWLKATKEIEIINEKRLKNATTEGTLVARDKVKIGILDPIDGCFRNLIVDGSKTIAVKACAMRDAGDSIEDIQTQISDRITQFIRPVKTKVVRIFEQI